MLKIGQKVEDFGLEAFHNNKIKNIKLSDYTKKGKWVILLFYPADFTFVCPTELEEAADHHQDIQKLGAEVMSVSTDTAYTHQAWHEASDTIAKVKYPMLSDPTGKVCRQFGTYIEDEGLSQRGTFIIDPKHILKSADTHDNSIGRNINEIIRRLQAAIFVSQHKGLVCPASWQPGKKTLKTE